MSTRFLEKKSPVGSSFCKVNEERQKNDLLPVILIHSSLFSRLVIPQLSGWHLGYGPLAEFEMVYARDALLTLSSVW